MPELPELEVVRDVLRRRLIGRHLEHIELRGRGAPIVVRDLTGAGFASVLQGRTLAAVERRGKFLLLTWNPESVLLAINPKLTGRLQLCPPTERRSGPLHIVFTFSDPADELRYLDQKRMGQLYLARSLSDVPGLNELGPEPMEISLDDFRRQLKRARGEVKGVITRGRIIAGIGNAYADEILWQARLHPYRKRTSLSNDEIERLFRAMQETLADSVEKVRQEMGDNIHLKPRDFFSIHMRGGEPCPRCGTAISSITANQRITNFCRTCQPGGLIQGMDRQLPDHAG
jgi:formamidopyrimidine-DNA glycosylase